MAKNRSIVAVFRSRKTGRKVVKFYKSYAKFERARNATKMRYVHHTRATPAAVRDAFRLL